MALAGFDTHAMYFLPEHGCFLSLAQALLGPGCITVARGIMFHANQSLCSKLPKHEDGVMSRQSFSTSEAARCLTVVAVIHVSWFAFSFVTRQNVSNTTAQTCEKRRRVGLRSTKSNKLALSRFMWGSVPQQRRSLT